MKSVDKTEWKRVISHAYHNDGILWGDGEHIKHLKHCVIEPLLGTH